MDSLHSFSNAEFSNPESDTKRHHAAANVEAKWRNKVMQPPTSVGKPRVVITRLSRSFDKNSQSFEKMN